MNRFNITENGYKYDKLLFYGFFIIVLSVVGYLLYESDFDFNPKVYFNCDNPFGQCENPFYDGQYRVTLFGEMKYFRDLPNCEWCGEKYLGVGEYGEKEKPFIKNILYYILLGVVALLILNHFLHNKGKMPELWFFKYLKNMEE